MGVYRAALVLRRHRDVSPYNVHFLHDIGAFLLGIGAALLAALVWRDATFVILLGGSAAAVIHWLSHVIDRDHGESSSDPGRSVPSRYCWSWL